MQRTIYFIYDDSDKLPPSISGVVGERSFGDVIQKKVKLKDKIKHLIEEIKEIKFIELKDFKSRNQIISRFKEEHPDTVYIHFFSKAVIIDKDNFFILLDKVNFLQSTVINQEIDPYILIFTQLKDYEDYLNLLSRNNTITKDDLGGNCFVFTPNDFAKDISDISSFLNYFSGGFEARYFNQLVGDGHTLVKKSSDKLKIEKEYQYYHLLPDPMKKWYVMPYDFRVEEAYASYTMERLNIPDMALQWIHNAISLDDLSLFLDKIFTFVSTRPLRKIDKAKYLNRFKDLYYQKVLERIEKLRGLAEFSKIDTYIVNGTAVSLDQVFQEYVQIFDKLIKEIDSFIEVIGHGDLCFSNILYDKNSYMMKFIDTKGALKEEDLWTDPYYDLAKLSHSILGNYDFINNELFSINLNNSLSLDLNIKSTKLTQHQNLFIQKVNEYGYDIRLIRLCEASLFLSMLPLHIDNPRKVLAFILNAIHIKEELILNV